MVRKPSHTGKVYIIIFNDALCIPKMTHSLVNPNQLINFLMVVQDNPSSLSLLRIRTEDAKFDMHIEM